ncbi:MAG: hypothetical protein M4579_000005 [Chaenotheca gracillima]|nr:MAG: hypothetical protein M4579_000005 [Chaenotheca gracillima]
METTFEFPNPRSQLRNSEAPTRLDHYPNGSITELVCCDAHNDFKIQESETLRTGHTSPHDVTPVTGEAPPLSFNISEDGWQARVVPNLEPSTGAGKRDHDSGLNALPSEVDFQCRSSGSGVVADAHVSGASGDVPKGPACDSPMPVDALSLFVEPQSQVGGAPLSGSSGMSHKHLTGEGHGKAERQSTPTLGWQTTSNLCSSPDWAHAELQRPSSPNKSFSSRVEAKPEETNPLHISWWGTAERNIPWPAQGSQSPRDREKTDEEDSAPYIMSKNQNANPVFRVKVRSNPYYRIGKRPFRPDRTLQPWYCESQDTAIQAPSSRRRAGEPFQNRKQKDWKQDLIDKQFAQELDRKLFWLSYELSSGLSESMARHRVVSKVHTPASHGATAKAMATSNPIKNTDDPESRPERARGLGSWRLAINKYRAGMFRPISDPLLHASKRFSTHSEESSAPIALTFKQLFSMRKRS